MHRSELTVALLAGCAYAMHQACAVNRQNLLPVARLYSCPANTPERLASMHSLPPNKVVQHTQGGGIRVQ